MTIPKLKICEPTPTLDDINRLCTMIKRLKRRVEKDEKRNCST